MRVLLTIQNYFLSQRAENNIYIKRKLNSYRTETKLKGKKTQT